MPEKLRHRDVFILLPSCCNRESRPLALGDQTMGCPFSDTFSCGIFHGVDQEKKLTTICNTFFEESVF